MNNRPQTSTDQTIPAWFADSTNSAPPTPQPHKSKKRLPLIIGSVVLLAAIGSTAWYAVAANNAKVEAFRSFETAYGQIEIALLNFDDITEPENLDTDTLATSWDNYTSALTSLTKTSLYLDNQSLIKSISTSSLAYETYLKKVLPSLNHYLSECYVSGDSTMYNETCRGYIQSAVNAGDPLTKDTSLELLTLLTQLSQGGVITQTQTDSVLELQDKLFSVGTTIQSTVRPKVNELGEKVGIRASPIETDV